MKTILNDNGILIFPKKDKSIDAIEILKSFNLLEPCDRQYILRYEDIKILIEENEYEILNDLNFIFPFEYEKLKIKLNSIVKINSKTISFFYDNFNLFLKNEYVFYTSESFSRYIYIYDCLKKIKETIDNQNLEFENKIQKLLKLQEKYKFVFDTPKKYILVSKYNFNFIPNNKDKNIKLMATVYGIKDRLLASTLNSNQILIENENNRNEIFVLDEELIEDLQNLDEFKEKDRKDCFNIIINEDNFDRFKVKMENEFSDTLYEKISERFEGIIYTPNKLYPEIVSSSGLSHLIYLDKRTLFSIPLEELSEEDKQKLEYEINKAKIENKSLIYFNGRWIDISNVFCESSTEEMSKNEFHFQIKIKTNEEKNEYIDYYEKEKDEIEDIQLDKNFLSDKLFDYQMFGIKKIIKSYLLGFKGFLLADDMGLGKTLQAIYVIKYFLNYTNFKKIMIVCPLSLKENWKLEIERYCNELSKYIIYNLSEMINKDKFIFIVNYDLISSKFKEFIRFSFDVIIADEIQRMKTYTTKISRAMKAIKSNFRLGLSATPIENNIIEFWNIMDFLVPGLLKSKKDFKEEYIIINDSPKLNEASIKANELLNIIEPVFLRRTKNELASQLKLPRKNFIYKSVYLTKHQTEAYVNVYRTINTDFLIGTVQQLLQVCDCSSNKIIIKDIYDFKQASGKLQTTIDLVHEIKKKNEKLLIFTRFWKTQFLLKNVLKDHGFNSEIINGKISEYERKKIVNEFTETDKYDVLIINPKVGGVGLNLVKANNVIHYTLEWNYSVLDQATDRTYRIGQNKDVNCYIIYSLFPNEYNNNNTVEEYLINLIEKKKNISNFFINVFNEKKEIEDLEKNLVSSVQAK